jgi:hypothetical protein
VISSGLGRTMGRTSGQTLWSKAMVRRVMVNLTMGRLDHHNTACLNLSISEGCGNCTPPGGLIFAYASVVAP